MAEITLDMQHNEHNTPSQDPKPQPKHRRRWLRALLITLGALLGIVLLTVAAVIIWLGPIAERVVEEYDKELVGRRIELSNLRIRLFDGTLTADSLYLYEANDSTEFVSINRFEGDIALGEILDRHIDIRRIALGRPRVEVVQNGSEFNFDDMVTFITTTYASTEEPEPESEPWRISLKNISIEGGAAGYLDRELDQTWRADDLALHCDSIMLSNVMTYIDAQMTINRTASLKGHMGINLDNLDFEFAGQLREFPLGELYKYIVPVVNLRELYGNLSTNVELMGNASNIMAMDISGDLSVDDLHITGPDGGQLLTANNLSADISELNIDKQRYILSSLTADGYYTQFIMRSDGGTNFDRLFYDEPEVNLETTSERVGDHMYDQRERVTITTENNVMPFSGMTLLIDHLRLSGGRVFFADKTMKKEFAYNLSNLSIESSNFNIATRNKLTVKANLQNKGTATLRWEGSLNDFYNQSLLASLSNVDMKDFTPYTEHYTAFPITSGNLTFRSQNTINNGELSGMNRLGTYDFNVGKKDKSLDPEYKLPLKLGVYVLTDKDKHIDVDLPITGHIDSPEFSFRKMIFKAIGNLLLKIVASPFQWMSPDKQDAFRAIDFTLLDPALNSEQYARLDKMAEALKEDNSIKVRMIQRVNYERATRDIADLNLKMAYYNSTQANPNERLDMLDFVRINEMRLSRKEVSEFADSQLIARGIDPQHMSTHDKARALYGDLIDTQLQRMMDARNKTIREYISFQHKELPAESFTIESMTTPEMQAYKGKSRLAMALIIDDEEVEIAPEVENVEEEDEELATDDETLDEETDEEADEVSETNVEEVADEESGANNSEISPNIDPVATKEEEEGNITADDTLESSQQSAKSTTDEDIKRSEQQQ